LAKRRGSSGRKKKDTTMGGPFFGGWQRRKFKASWRNVVHLKGRKRAYQAFEKKVYKPRGKLKNILL